MVEESWPSDHWRAHPGAADVATELAEQRFRMAKQSSLAVHASIGGLVFADLGGTDLPVRCQSTRKSMMSALIGVAIERGLLTLDATIDELGVDDIDSLSDEEKTATVRDLLMARSGVYHPAAYQENPHPLIPTRHTHRHGERWVYNNWDFNALGTILERATGLKTFDAFAEWFGEPLQLEDFDPAQCEYSLEDVSRHPAYDFRISAPRHGAIRAPVPSPRAVATGQAALRRLGRRVDSTVVGRNGRLRGAGGLLRVHVVDRSTR